jgi:molybdopterin/thiamine biosynthesis adenylyltransferase
MMDRKTFTFKRLSRQTKLLGWNRMEKLKSLVIAVVGCGRNGSFFSNLAAYAGIFNLVLIDPDVMNAHNVNASILFGYRDIGKKKVEVVKERIQSIDPAIICDVHPCAVEDSSVSPVLNSCDIIVSAVDSIPTKNFLNSFVSGAIKRGKPICLLDLASGAYVESGKILLLGGQATLFAQGEACLLCGGLDEDDLTNLSNVSFVIPNGFSALLGIELLISYITDYDNPAGESKEKYNFILYDCLSHQLVKLNRASRKNCKFCGKRS